MHEIKVEVYSVTELETVDISALCRLASTVASLFVFKPSPNPISVEFAKNGELPVSVALDCIQKKVATNEDKVAAIGVTSCRLDCSDDIVLDTDARIALISDFYWNEADMLCGELIRWLYNMFVAAIRLLSEAPCQVQKCICNETTSFRPDAILTTYLCDNCKKAILSTGASLALQCTFSTLSWFQRNITCKHDIAYLARLSQQNIRELNSLVDELVVDEHFIRSWLAQKPGLQTAVKEPFSTLPIKIFEAAPSIDAPREYIKAMRQLVEKTRHVDTLLFLTRKRHKDHSHHQAYVVGLGWFLLLAWIASDERLIDQILGLIQTKYSSKGICSSIDEHDLVHTWILTALLHDGAYALSHMLSIVANLTSVDIRATDVDFDLIAQIVEWQTVIPKMWQDFIMRVKQDWEAGATSYNDVCQQLHDRITSQLQAFFSLGAKDDERGLLPSALQSTLDAAKTNRSLVFDHGLLSATIIAEVLISKGCFTAKSGLTPSDLVLREAIEAIALHNVPLDEPGVKLNFEEYPLAVLLRFCDELQEWDRGTISEGRFNVETDRITMVPVVNVAGNVYLGHELRVIFDYPDGEKLLDKGWNVKSFMKTKKQLRYPGFPFKLSFEIRLPFQTEGSEPI